MKKTLAILLMLVLIVTVMVGCGSSSTSSSTSSTVAPAPASTASTSTVAEKAVTLKYFTWDYSDRTKSTDTWIKNLKDKHNITIDMQNVPTDQYPAIFKTHIAANDMPDIVNIHGISTDPSNNFTAEKTNIKTDLFIDISGLSSISNYIPSIIDSAKKNGKLYYVPVSTNVLGALYNKKVFSDNGVSIPTNIDEFTAALDKFKAAKIIPIASGAKDAWTTQLIPFIAFAQYVNVKDETIKVKLANGSMKYADIKTDLLKVLSIQKEWAKKNYFQDSYLGTDINVASQLVGTGKAAMLINGTWQLKSIQDADPSAQIGFFAVPFNAAGTKTEIASSADGGLCISSSSTNLDAAKQTLDYYLSPEIQNLVMVDLNGISTNNQVKLDVPFLTDVTNAMSTGNVQADWWGTNNLYAPQATSFTMETQMQSLLAGSTTPEKFISDYDSANAKVFTKK